MDFLEVDSLSHYRIIDILSQDFQTKITSGRNGQNILTRSQNTRGISTLLKKKSYVDLSGLSSHIVIFS